MHNNITTTWKVWREKDNKNNINNKNNTNNINNISAKEPENNETEDNIKLKPKILTPKLVVTSKIDNTNILDDDEGTESELVKALDLMEDNIKHQVVTEGHLKEDNLLKEDNPGHSDTQVPAAQYDKMTSKEGGKVTTKKILTLKPPTKKDMKMRVPRKKNSVVASTTDKKQQKISLMFKPRSIHKNSKCPAESESDIECSNSLSEPNLKRPRLSEQICMSGTSIDTSVINPGLENNKLKTFIQKSLE